MLIFNLSLVTPVRNRCLPLGGDDKLLSTIANELSDSAENLIKYSSQDIVKPLSASEKFNCKPSYRQLINKKLNSKGNVKSLA